MLQILFAVFIVFAFISLISHILHNGKKDDTVKVTVKGGAKAVLKVSILFAIFIAGVYFLIHIL